MVGWGSPVAQELIQQVMLFVENFLFVGAGALLRQLLGLRLLAGLFFGQRQKFIVGLLLRELFLEALDSVHIELLSFLVLDLVVEQHADLGLVLQKLDPFVLRLRLDELRARVDLTEELFQVSQLELLLLRSLFAMDRPQVAVNLLVAHVFGPVHELVHEEGDYPPLEVMHLFLREGNFSLLVDYWPDGKLLLE